MCAASTDNDLKSRHRAMWSLGDYAQVASTLIAPMGTTLVEACGIGPGQRVLDVAAGAGNAAIPAARSGAQVVAADLTPALIEQGRQSVRGLDLDLEWREADAEALPFADAEFDAVVSTVGVMFAPHHQRAADELVRVAKPGGVIGLASWTPTGFIGQMLATMRPYAPAPPPGAQPPPLWGREEHVRELLGDRVEVRCARPEMVSIDSFATAEDFRDFFKAYYGPTIAAYRYIAEDPDAVRDLDEALADLARRHDLGGGRMDWEYLLLTAEVH